MWWGTDLEMPDMDLETRRTELCLAPWELAWLGWWNCRYNLQLRVPIRSIQI